MKICLLAPANNIHTQKIAYSLLRGGYEVIICTFHNAKISGIKVIYFPPIISIFKKLNYIFNIPRLKKIINDINPDVLHAHYVSSYGVVGYLTKFHPLIISVWGSDIYDAPKNPIFKFFIKLALVKAEAVLSTSKTMVRQTQRFVSNKEIVVTPFGVELSKFYPTKKQDNSKFIIGTARTLTRKYGIKYLIRAFSIFLKEVANAQLVIVGNGPQKNELMNIAKKLGIEKSVKFLGFIRHDRLPKIIANMDVFCMPSIRESFGVAALEAQACSIPVISSNVGGLSETIIDGKTGFLVKPKDPYAIVDKCLFLYKNPVVRKNMGEEARKFVTKYYNWSNNIKIIKRIYRKFNNYAK